MLYGGSLGRYQEVTAPPKVVKERIDNELGEVGKESWRKECGNWAKHFGRRSTHSVRGVWRILEPCASCCPPVKASIINFHVDTTLVDV